MTDVIPADDVELTILIEGGDPRSDILCITISPKEDSPPLLVPFRRPTYICNPSANGATRSYSTPRSQSHMAHSSGPLPPRSSGTNPGQSTPPSGRDIQLSRYLLEIRSHQTSRSALFGILFAGTKASFWYADADSTIKSTFIPIDSVEFVTAVVCLSRADARKLGYSPYFQSNGAVMTGSSIAGARFSFQTGAHPPKSREYALVDPIFVSRAFHGRCPRALGATDLATGEPCVLKLSYQVVTRHNEADLIALAFKRGVKGLIPVRYWVDLEKLSDGPRSRLPPGILPTIRPDLLLEDRVLRLLVLPRCMHLYQVTKPEHFLKACISLLETICDLYEIGKIMHRDVSVNNLMVKIEAPWEGVLIDVDLGVDVGTERVEPSSLYRTGTLPFMARDLLHDDNTYPQYHRHDLESFLYVIFWIAGQYVDGTKEANPLFTGWCEGPWDDIRARKTTFCDRFPQAFVTKSYEFLIDTIYAYQAIISSAYRECLNKLYKAIQHRNHNMDPSGGYAETPTGSKRKAIDETLVFPEHLEGLDRKTLVAVLRGALDGLEADAS